MTPELTTGSRTACLARRLRNLSIRVPGRGDKDRISNGNSEEEPEFRITRTPDRPSRLIKPSEAPSEEECREDIAVWRRMAQGEDITRAGNMARERREGHRPRGFISGSSDTGSEYEDLDVNGYGYKGGGEEERGQLTTHLHGRQPRQVPTVALRRTESSRRLTNTVNKHDSDGTVSLVGSDVLLLSPPSGRTGGSRGLLLSPGNIRASAGSSSDGGESYHGEVVEAEQVDVQRLYELESARRGFCLRCRSHTIARGSWAVSSGWAAD